jgi:glycerophosphoryl diester phosphodiesterase
VERQNWVGALQNYIRFCGSQFVMLRIGHRGARAYEPENTLRSFKKALDFLDKKVKIVIELKETGYEEKVLAAVHQNALEKNVVIVSFKEEALRKAKDLDSQVETGLIYVKHKNPVKAALDLKASYLLPLYRFTHTANVQKAHENGLKVIVWTINKPEEAAEYQKKGVDGIASDKPDILKKAN